PSRAGSRVIACLKSVSDGRCRLSDVPRSEVIVALGNVTHSGVAVQTTPRGPVGLGGTGRGNAGESAGYPEIRRAQCSLREGMAGDGHLRGHKRVVDGQHL